MPVVLFLAFRNIAFIMYVDLISISINYILLLCYYI